MPRAPAIPYVRVAAVLETMWDWRGMTSEAGYQEAPRWFRINGETSPVVGSIGF